MAAGPQAFYRLWQNEDVREKLFESLEKEDICNVRLANSACCNLVTKRLFLRTHLSFTANTFTRESRIQALSRIGHHIEHLTFYLPHSDATFLPPLIHPETGREVSFLYTPHTSMASVLARPKFANTELGDILTHQYPPLFHAASNVPSFIHAMKHLTKMRHLTIKTPGQSPKERYRRDIADYALISLRIAVERAPLTKLSKLSLSSVHPAAFVYLRHVPGFGCTPSAGRRWQQIRKLNVSVDSWDFYGPSPGLDHLKVIDDFIRTFTDCLDKFTFTWLGRKGPCPVSLAADPLFSPPRSSRKLFQEVTSPMSPLPPTPAKKSIAFRKLRYLSVRNATMNAPQVAELVAGHRHCVREFDFENVVLINNGSWDEALAPLTDRSSRSDNHWKRHSTNTAVDVISIQPDIVDEQESTSSAAVAAVSAELLALELNTEEPESGINIAEWAEDLPSDVEAARQASLTFSTKLQKRRITKRRRKRKHSLQHQQEEDEDAAEEQEKPEKHHFMPWTRRLFSKTKESVARPQTPEPVSPGPELPQLEDDRSCSRLLDELDSRCSQSQSGLLFGEVASNFSRSSQRLFGEVEPELSHSPMDDEESLDDYFRPKTPTSGSGVDISAPILNTQPSMPTLLKPTVYDPMGELCYEISAVQRDIEAEEAQRMLAEDAVMRTSALKKAREAVLIKLSEQFTGAGRKLSRKESVPSSSSSAMVMGASMRLREGLFGKSSPVVSSMTDHRSMDVPILFSR